MRIGYALSSEEHGPCELVRYARMAEHAGFQFALISDHFHPWTDQQGQSPFVWPVIGGIAMVNHRMPVGTAVTCPLIRMHPAVVAQAAATAATMLPGRFLLGLGTGENLNEHITGQGWPASPLRLEMLEEAIGIIRALWRGGWVTRYGKHFVVEEVRLYTLPERLPPILLAAGGGRAAEPAGRLADGLLTVRPDPQLVRSFEQGGGQGKPRYGQFKACWARDEAAARETARRWWPNQALPGELGSELRLPRHVEQAVRNIRDDQSAAGILCGPDSRPHLEKIEQYAAAGYDHVYVHQVGPDQEGFFEFYRREILPRFQGTTRKVA